MPVTHTSYYLPEGVLNGHAVPLLILGVTHRHTAQYAFDSNRFDRLKAKAKDDEV